MGVSFLTDSCVETIAVECIEFIVYNETSKVYTIELKFDSYETSCITPSPDTEENRKRLSAMISRVL